MASLEGKTAEEIAQLASLAQSLADNPATRLGFLQLTKTANPNVSIPEIDIPASIKPAFQKQIDRLTKMEEENANFRMERAVLTKRQELLDDEKLGISKSDIPAIEKLMLDKGIPDHHTAAEFFNMQRKTAVPTPSNAQPGMRQNSMPAMDLKPFNGDLNNWARSAAAKAIDEMRSGQIKLA